MPLPHQALVLVTDGRKTLFFRNHGDENQIDLRTEAHDEREDAPDREMKTDAPGAIGSVSPYTDAASSSSSSCPTGSVDR